MPAASAPEKIHRHPANVDHFRKSRRVRRNLKLHRQVRDLITANAACRYIGGNAAVEKIAADCGFEPHDLAVADVKVGRRVITLICVPHRIWDRTTPSTAAIAVRMKARNAGYSAVLVPQAVVEREPRLGNSELLARTATITVDATSRMRVLAHLIENGTCCLSELAALLDHRDPFGAVLHMVVTGALALNIGQCITPYSMVDIASPCTHH